MPQHDSAVKRVRQNEKNRQRNQGQRSKMKTLVKRAMNTTDKEEAEEAVKEATSYLDKMASRDLIHKNYAARRKSRLAKHLDNL